MDKPLPCPDCGQRVVVPGVGVETHVCADPAKLRQFFADMAYGIFPEPVPSARDGAMALIDLDTPTTKGHD